MVQKPDLILCESFQGETVHPSVTPGAFGGLAVVGGLLSFLPPDTMNRLLPETLEEGERFGL